ncbi:MAG: AMP-binding protein [Rhizobiaceae bacterium]
MSLPDVATLIDLLEFRARETPDRNAFHIGGNPVTYSGLWNGINSFATHLLSAGVRSGDRVLVLIPNGSAFFEAFYGVQRAGAIAVPLFPGFGPDKIASFARLTDAKIAVLNPDLPLEQASEIRRTVAGLGTTLTTTGTEPDPAINVTFPVIKPDDISFIQYTSGSTGDPKGVMISHDNLLTNMRQMIEGMEITADDVFVSWLPVYHDMGLILKTMVPFYLGLELHLLSTDLRYTSVWLKALETHKATFTAAPDFAYRLCLRQIREASAYDLSSLRMALNAAEPVRHNTVEKFEATFGLRNVIVPAYGLAEATVGVSTWPPGHPVKVDFKGNVSAGQPFRGVEIAIVGDDHERLGAGEIGEIAVKSSALPAGYYNNPQATEALRWEREYILTGDLGYLDADGDLFIVGRKKNAIIQSGRTFYGREIEEIADSVAEVRMVAAIGIDRQRLEGEQVYVFGEVRPGSASTAEKSEAIVQSIVGRIFGQLGIRPGRVYLLKPRSIPMTYNGKIRHEHLRESYLDGSLFKQGRILFPDY